MRFLFQCVLFCFVATNSIVEGDELDESNISLNGDPLFVSLGADCLTAGMIQHFGKRQSAFPFDWLVTLDGMQLIHVLNNDFQDFVNKDYLVRHPIEGKRLVHRGYHMEFTHDWNDDYWLSHTQYDEGIEKLQIKYQRRITRFKQLANSKCKVVFIRLLLPVFPIPELYWFDYPPQKNEREYSLDLYRALQNLFPHLDFKLVVVCKADSYRREVIDDITLYYFSDVREHSNWAPLFNE